jgi:type II secretory pathway pseudopilin PulG
MFIKIKMKHSLKNQEGFTLLFASLVVTLVLSIGLAIANITLTQLVLSTSGRESQFAFYNADSGIECALYHEFTNSAVFPATGDDVPDSSVSCDGLDPQQFVYSQTGATTTTSFWINPPDGYGEEDCDLEKPSFYVEVNKSPHPTLTNASNVYIESRGYNTCDDASPRRVERGLYVRFVD